MRGDAILAEDIANLVHLRIEPRGFFEVTDRVSEAPRLDGDVPAQEMRQLAVRVRLEKLVRVLLSGAEIALQERT
jgi:hypothetical protein